MHKKFIQISVISNDRGIVLYALDIDGNIFEKLVGLENAPWTMIR